MELHIKNLPFALTENELKKIFEPYGVEKVKIITDRQTCKSKGFGFVEIPDKVAAEKAVRECNNKDVQGRYITVSKANPRNNPHPQGSGQRGRTERNSRNIGIPQRNGDFPYRFCKRNTAEKKQPPFHDSLKHDRYDIAFETEWTTKSPTALNPCIVEKEDGYKVDANNPKTEDESEFAGYNKRWFMNKNRMVISPFTVKSAIAVGFANLMGGCYRVIDKTEPHPSKVKEGHYYYKGGYKRYRVSMNKSKSGIITNITVNKDGSRNVTIKPMIEYYYDRERHPGGVEFVRGEKYCAVTCEERHRNIIRPAESLRKEDNPEKTGGLIYLGEYRFGMNLGLRAPHLNKNHCHRFVSMGGPIISGTVPGVNFETPKQLEEKVYMGDFRHVGKPDPRPEGGFWYEDLNDLEMGHWVYYQSFYDPEKQEETVTNIGKNFQFKALFFHEDAVPENQKLCREVKMLCPRCRMFGMTAEKTEEERKSLGFKGRFKASALVGNAELEKIKGYSLSIPGENKPVDLVRWGDKNKNMEQAAYQALLPIAGPPKPNKRDVDGYFDDQTGQIRGAKIYKHAALKSARNISGVDTYDDKDYTHRLRNYAMVCEKEQTFTGTVGAENCDIEEIAALVLLLDYEQSGHGFKIGLGKAFGMGSVTSAITTVWIRKKESYGSWDKMSLQDFLKNGIKDKDIEKNMNNIKKLHEFMNQDKDMEKRELCYPPPVKKEGGRTIRYWSVFDNKL
ncbi:MAG: hypothetical protein GY795_12025 [Desulfobacterales bacterium]|nr:hypothetical protein [Desulfobacterales bacterium]